ncbi:unnamed protein product [Vitrella brassicaformis CCMP3155]|uniref:H(+)-exporting diphosphatase n=1 Tax=Vitrella brassicaformis (strain CCMP3155) TaxID=1169540 RepID=A0A0G4GS33_VITBC|nr:unnamed protein product [Vitrella brassicaformis CCMP3155]|eukprot:CEM33422.1 unnamed protein product [Vitrella brassicaformis CCMP3155]
MELDYFVSVFQALTGISSLLAGFASAGILLGVPAQNNPFLKLGFVTSTGAALGFNLLVVLIGSLVVMWGPGRALRGEGVESVSFAVEFMEVTSETCLIYFVLGLGCYFASSVFAAWILFKVQSSIFISVFFLVAAFVLIQQVGQLYLELKPPIVISGRIRGNPLRVPVDSTSSGGTYATGSEQR